MAGSAAVMAMTLGWANPAHARKAPDLSVCERFPLHPEANDEREDPLALPADWAGIAASSRNWIAIATEYRTTYCVNTERMLYGGNFERFGDRFIGFSYVAAETHGYMLIDRAGQGRAIDTGVRPHFSPDGSKFAVLNRADTGMEGFDGFAIWHTYGNLLTPYLVNAGPPLYPMLDWAIDYWDGENCLHISAVPYDELGAGQDTVSDDLRYSYVAHPAIEWQIAEGETCSGSE